GGSPRLRVRAAQPAGGRASAAGPMTVLVAGIDSSTQSCKVVTREAASGALVREGRAAHPPGTEVDPAAWWQALTSALAEAGGLDGVARLSGARHAQRRRVR